MNLKNAMVCWNDDGNVELVALSDPTSRVDHYEKCCGACNESVRTANFKERKCLAFILANAMIVRDRCDPKLVHSVLSGLEEYIDGLPDDMLSATERKKRLEKKGQAF